MVADAQGEARSQGATGQFIVKSPDGNTPGIGTQAEEGQDALRGFIKGDGPILHHRHQVIPAHQVAGGPMVRQELEGLEIGHGMVKSWAIQRAVKAEIPVAQLQTLPGRQHGIRIILLHREDHGPGGHIAQGVKIPQDSLRFYIQFFKMPQTAVCRQQEIGIFQGFQKPVKFRRAKNHKFTHRSPPVIFLILSQIRPEGKGKLKIGIYLALPAGEPSKKSPSYDGDFH